MRMVSVWAICILLSACGGANPDAANQASSTAGRDDQGAKPAEIARDFWVSLSRWEYESASREASFPFDLDAHDECVERPEDLLFAFREDPFPEDWEMTVGEVHPIATDMDMSGLHEHWHELIPRFTDAQARCLGQDTTAEYHYFLVDFSVNGDLVGALTRVRCRLDECGVAGTDN